MNTFQSISVILLIGLLLKVLTSLRGGKTPPKVALAWTALAVTGILAILNPNYTVSVAAALGIGRGADLVFYCAIVAAVLGFYGCYACFRKIDSRLTILIRELALQEQKLAYKIEQLARENDSSQ
jgi:hypothetical protein